MKFKILLSILSLPFVLSTPHTTNHQSLNWDVYLVPAIPTAPFSTNLTFSPTAITLIHGVHSAILIDAPATVVASEALADWIETTIPGKKLTHVYITHGHGDHFFGVPVLQKRFPGLVPVATKRTINHIKQQLEKDFFNEFWATVFPGGQIPEQDEVFTAVPKNGEFYLENHILKVVEVGQSDTYNTTVLHVPDLDLVIGGDVIYGSCFQYLQETNTTALRKQWIHALDRVAALNPKHVVPSHKQVSDDYSPVHLARTQQYIRDWDREARNFIGNPKSLEARMKALYPGRIGEFILRLSAEGVIPS